MNKAKKEITPLDNFEDHESYKNQEFNALITDWTEKSQKILLMLNKNDQISTKNKNSKSLIALGAMGAHINMALQALKATDFGQ